MKYDSDNVVVENYFSSTYQGMNVTERGSVVAITVYVNNKPLNI